MVRLCLFYMSARLLFSFLFSVELISVFELVMIYQHCNSNVQALQYRMMRKKDLSISLGSLKGLLITSVPL